MLAIRKKFRSRAVLVLLAFGLAACNLEKDIDIELPPYTPQLVAECYLEPGKPYRLTLTQSSAYFDDPQPVEIRDATVQIIHKGVARTLRYQPFLDKKERKLYTHFSNTVVTGKPGDTYELLITDAKGRRLTASTTLLAPVPIDSVQTTFNDKGKAFVVARFRDSAARNFYLFSVHRDSTNQNAETDYTAPDNLSNGQASAFGTGYDYEDGDTIFVSLYHLEKAYFDFVNSVEEAREANGNPFAQPSRIRSTVQGGLGVFTNLAYDRKRVVLKRK